MKTLKVLVGVSLSMLFAGPAKAQEGARGEQYCAYGNLIPVPKYYFKKSIGGRFSQYEAMLPGNIRVTAGKTHQGGYSSIYEMRLDYNQGEVVIRDVYEDYMPYRQLQIEAQVNGLSVACYF